VVKIILSVCQPAMANRQFTNWNKRIWVAVSFGPRNDIYFGQRRDKQTARETIICRLATGNFEDETVSVQHIIYRKYNI